jgi:co-chaperonin GroES (HSP10)
VIVLPRTVEEKTSGGIIIPDQTKEREEFARVEGILVAASPMAFQWDDWPDERADEKPKVGDRVFFAKYNATELTGKDGQKYWLMKDEAVIGVLK